MKFQQSAQWTESIVHCGEGKYREYRIPGLLPIDDGAVLLTMEARAENLGDWGDIDILVLKRKKDGNLTRVLSIGEAHLPPDGQMRTYNNPVLIPDGDAVHLLYHRNYERAFIVTSTDGGLSWSEPCEITAAYRQFPYQWNVCATGPGHGIRLHSGRLLAPVWLANGELGEDGITRKHWPSVAGCIFSDDHGATWNPGALAEGIVNGNETTVAELSDGHVLLNIRNMEPAKRRALAISSDGGATLMPARLEEALPDPRCFGGMAQISSSVLFVNCVSETQRENLTITATNDEGKTWTPQLVVDDFGGYADIAVCDGQVLVFYERYSYEEGIVKELVLRAFSIET